MKIVLSIKLILSKNILLCILGICFPYSILYARTSFWAHLLFQSPLYSCGLFAVGQLTLFNSAGICCNCLYEYLCIYIYCSILVFTDNVFWVFFSPCKL
ncbi:hypothetical protein GDO86_002183 [Hymenochirus boettgeri]|uniref:Uncharacterized protein n=1 Tax=Hymenochirus boettgeri TaxID=247094 RepID=A0A8T2KHH2_9PIPI|nr:hypothetical protein GDO86_002183 [Hymenochirus boettgeri]